MRWRLLIDEAGEGAANMAVDESLLETAAAAAAGSSGLPDVTVRFYRFRRPEITIGYAQRIQDAVELTACAERGVPVVRRITGGRALLHGDDLTYSVAGWATGAFGDRSVREVYRLVAAPFRRALEALGVPLDAGGAAGAARSARGDASLPCLSVATGHEITSGGRKLVPSAQRWRRRAFLQHGSLLLRLREPLLRATTHVPEGPLPAVGLDDLGGPKSLDEAVLTRALVREYEDLLGGPPESDALGRDEKRRVETLTGKYRSSRWNLVVPRRSTAP